MDVPLTIKKKEKAGKGCNKELFSMLELNQRHVDYKSTALPSELNDVFVTSPLLNLKPNFTK